MESEVDFIAPCPILGCKNFSADKRFHWTHAACGGRMKVVRTGHLKCSSCLCTGEFLDWCYKCEDHNYKAISYQGMIFAMSVLAQLKGLSGEWFSDVTDRVREQEKKKPRS